MFSTLYKAQVDGWNNSPTHLLPAFGFVSEILPVFSRNVLIGYSAMVAATLAIAFISFGV